MCQLNNSRSWCGGSTDSATQTLSQSYLLGWMGSITEISSGKLLNAIIFAVFSTPPPHIPLYAIQHHHPPPGSTTPLASLHTDPSPPPFVHKLLWHVTMAVVLINKKSKTNQYCLNVVFYFPFRKVSRQNILVLNSQTNLGNVRALMVHLQMKPALIFQCLLLTYICIKGRVQRKKP